MSLDDSPSSINIFSFVTERGYVYVFFNFFKHYITNTKFPGLMAVGLQFAMNPSFSNGILFAQEIPSAASFNKRLSEFTFHRFQRKKVTCLMNLAVQRLKWCIVILRIISKDGFQKRHNPEEINVEIS